MRNPVAVNTPSSSYSLRTATPEVYGLDGVYTGLTITSTDPGNVTINSFIPRYSSEITEIYPGQNFEIFWSLTTDVAVISPFMNSVLKIPAEVTFASPVPSNCFFIGGYSAGSSSCVVNGVDSLN